MVIGPLTVAMTVCAVIAAVQLIAATGTVPAVVALLAAAGWLVKTIVGMPALLVVACLLGLAAVSPWFLLGGVALARGWLR